MSHIPVLIDSILPFFKEISAGIVVDGTFGAGGYSRKIFENYPQFSVMAFDQDDSVLPYADDLKKEFPLRFSFVLDNFENMTAHIESDKRVVGVVLDLGVSSMQIDRAERGFSYQQNAPLDMRMSQTSNITAADILNTWERADLRRLFWTYGEENFAPLIAANICHAREKKSLETTFELRDIVERAAHSVKSVMRIFQAIRIQVNDELGCLERGLENASRLLDVGGILAVVSFHSLEDRIVKDFMIEKGKVVSGSRYQPMQIQEKQFKILTKKPVEALADEVALNSRARSAKLRVLQKIS